jgi:hypothetical protein
MFVDTAYQFVQGWMKGIYGMINPAAAQAASQTIETVVQNVSQKATETASQIPATPIIEAVKTAANETVKMGLWDRLSSAASGTYGWGTSFVSGTWNVGSSVVSNGASIVSSIFSLGKHSVKALDKAAVSGDLITTTFKNTIEYVDTLGIALYKGYLIISPTILVEIFKAAEQRIKQEDQSMEREHPVGWGVATLMTTAVSAYMLYSMASMLLRRTKNQSELSEITHELGHLIKVQNNRGFLSLVLNTTKTLGISAALFCVSAAVSLPMLVAAPVAAVPVLIPVFQWLWKKGSGEVEKSQLEEVVACAQMLQGIQEGIETSRFKEQARAILLQQAAKGDAKALDKLYSIIDRATIMGPDEFETKAVSEPIKGKPPVLIYTKSEPARDAKSAKADTSSADKPAVSGTGKKTPSKQ